MYTLGITVVLLSISIERLLDTTVHHEIARCNVF